jgi:hypothetical protein
LGYFEQLATERFEPRCDFEQNRFRISGDVSPQLVHLLADQRPIFHSLGRQRNGENLRVEFPDHELDFADQLQSEPSHRADNDHQAQQCDHRRSQPAATQSLGQPIKQWIQCNG